MAIPIDRFRAQPLPPRLEALAQEKAAGLNRNSDLLLGYLQSSVAHALARPRWKNRDRLIVDLRTIDIVLSRR